MNSNQTDTIHQLSMDVKENNNDIQTTSYPSGPNSKYVNKMEDRQCTY